MARPRTHRLKINGTLETVGPLHVGTMRDSPETDMPLARDGQGRWYVPGTSLAGPMRAWVHDHFDKTVAAQVFGYQEDGGVGGYASYLIIEDACVKLPDGLNEEIWDGVGIDRQWGVAAEGVKYDRAILPKGTTLDLRMTVELSGKRESAGGTDPRVIRAVIGHLVSALTHEQLSFGAAKTRGLGNVQLKKEGLQILEEDWSNKNGIQALLSDKSKNELSPGDLKQCDQTTKPRNRRFVSLKIRWKPDGPVMVKAGQDGVAVDMIPLLSGVEANEIALVLPGSSLKGALRSQAERIIRTVLDRDPLPDWDTLENRNRHLCQVDEPLVREVFGVAKRHRRESADRKPGLADDRRPGRGALQVSTCYARNAWLKPAQWRKIVQAPNDEGKERPGRSPLYSSIDQAVLLEGESPANQPYLQQAFHVAVDRWTGGAAQGFLYSTLEPFNVSWDDICLTLDLDFLSDRILSPTFDPKTEPKEIEKRTAEVERKREYLSKSAVVLLLLLARDLGMNRLALGFGGNRGYGSISVEDVSVEARGIDWLKPATLTKLGKGDLSEVSNLDELQTAWTTWIEAATANEKRRRGQ